MRTVVQSYRPSKSATALAQFLQLPRLKHRNSTFRGRASDIIVNWGNVRQVHNAQYLNPLDAVQAATNKATTFQILKAANIPIPEVHTSLATLRPDTQYFARTTLTGHSGEGIIVGTSADLPQAPLYTQYIPKVNEYRAIVVGTEVVDLKIKLKKRDFEGERSPYIWNVANGYVFARNDVTFPPALTDLAVQTLQALNLTYGAVDIIEDSNNNFYILEVNTAFGLEGSTISLVGTAIQKIIEEKRRV